MKREFFISIPKLLEARESDQWERVFSLCFDDELINSPECFKRGTNRFYLLDRLEIPKKNKKKLEHIKELLDISNKAHKKDRMSTTELIALDRQVEQVDKVTYADVPLTATKAASQYWS